MGVLHGPAGLGSFKFEVAYHVTGIADIPNIVERIMPGGEFEVEVRVMDMDYGWELWNKKIQVVDENFDVVGTGTLTSRAWNALYGKYEYFGRVKVVAPLIPKEYTWYGQFPRQDVHEMASDPFTFEVTIAVAFALTIRTEPPGAMVKLDGVERKTPVTFGVSAGTFIVTVPEKNFVEWEDGSTDPVRTIEVMEDIEITAYYKPGVPWGRIAIGAAATVTVVTIIYAVSRKR